MTIRTVVATRYLTPLREGSSLPAIVEADDGELYVMKFVGAGHGHKALIAELVAGEIGRALGLNIPEIVFIELDAALGPSEPNWEIHNLLVASAGLNLGLRYLPHAFTFNQLLQPPPADELASLVVWFDAYITNIDRTPKNVNLLIWQKDLWLIDHGASLYFHHNWIDYQERSRTPFPLIAQHTLLRFADRLDETDHLVHARLSDSTIDDVVHLIPEVWLGGEPLFASPDAHRQAYADYLVRRLQASPIFVEEAKRARAQLI